MPVRVKKSHPALKHAGYSATTILPGESAAEFEKLHRDLIAKHTPNGALENDIVATMARLLWRKENLATLRIAEFAQRHSDQLVRKADYSSYVVFDDPDPAKREEAIQAAKDRAREELGDAHELVEIGEAATIDGLMNDLDVLDRLDAMVDRCVKRLLMVRGLKSMSAASSSAPPEPLAGPWKALTKK